MAGGLVKYRHLSRKSSHRQALLRNLVTSLFTHESITTTWHKAKEAQRLAEKLITLGKKNTNASRRRATQIFFTPGPLVEKLFTSLRTRYLNRPGGYTRVLRIEPTKEDQAESAILELVDGPRDMRFAMTAKVLAHQHHLNKPINEITESNIKKVTQFRPDGANELDGLVEKFLKLEAVRETEEERRLEGFIGGKDQEVQEWFTKGEIKKKLVYPPSKRAKRELDDLDRQVEKKRKEQRKRMHEAWIG